MSLDKPIIEVDAEGVPLDKALRTVALRIRSFSIRGETSLDANLRRLVRLHLPHLDPDWRKGDDDVWPPRRHWRRFYERQTTENSVDLVATMVEAVVESLLSTGRLLRTPSGVHHDGRQGWEYSFPSHRDPAETPEARASNWMAAVDGIVGRISDDEAVRERAKILFMRARNLYASHMVDAPFGRSVLVPQGFDLTPQGPAITKAIVFTDAPGGIQIRVGKNVSISWDGCLPVLSLGKGFRQGAWLRRKFSTERLSPRSPDATEMSKLADTLRNASRYFKGRKSLVSEIVGEDLSDRRWRSFLRAIERGSDLKFMIASQVFKLLEPEARRAALRNPFATYGSYAWYRCIDQETAMRRRQAAESYPFMAARLPGLEDAIDGGRPLAESVSAMNGMSTAQLRSLGVLHWQRLGKVVHEAHTFDEPDFVGVPPERMPRSKKDWALHMGKLRVFRWNLAPELIAPFNKASSSDREGYDALLKKDLAHALASTASDLLPLMTGQLHKMPAAPWQAQMALTAALGGETFGLKRLRRFNEQWHAGTVRRTSVLQARRRKAFNGVSARWRPLVDDDFKSGNGTLRFLLNEDDLVAEGQLMNHCVGSYVWDCVSGFSHIAVVEGARGGRSTAEFYLEHGDLGLAQHCSFYNREPPEDCVGVVGDFFATYGSRRFEAMVGEGSSEGFGVSVEADEETLAELRELFSDCLPSAVLAMDRRQWAGLMAKFDASAHQRRPEDREDDYDFNGRY